MIRGNKISNPASPFPKHTAFTAALSLLLLSACAPQSTPAPSVGGIHNGGEATSTGSLNQDVWSRLRGPYTGTLFATDWDNIDGAPRSQSYEYTIGETTLPGRTEKVVGMTLRSTGTSIGDVSLSAPAYFAVNGQTEAVVDTNGGRYVHRYKLVSSYVFKDTVISPNPFVIVASLAFQAPTENGGTRDFDPAQSEIYFQGCELTGGTSDDGTAHYDCGLEDLDGNGQIDSSEENTHYRWDSYSGDAYFGNDIVKR